MSRFFAWAIGVRRVCACVAALLLAGASIGVHAEKAVRRSATGEPQTLDPQLWVYGQDGNIAQDLFQGLTTLDAQARVVPGAAQSWTVSEDGRTYTYRVREGLRWSDGRPLTSADFLYSFQRLFDPRTASPSASILFMIRNARAVASGKLSLEALGLRAPGAQAIVIELEHPAPHFNELIVHRAFPVPKHVIERHGREWTRPGRIVSNGAFVLAEWRPNAYVKLVKNAHFHEAASVALDAIYHVPVEDPNAALTRFRAGELDVIVQLPSERIAELRREYGAQLRLVRQVGLEYLAFNTRRPPFGDVRVRRALSMAIDRSVLTGKILQAGEPEAFCLVPKGVLHYPRRGCADFAALGQTERIAQARRLLTAAGFGTARPLTLAISYSSGGANRRLAVAIGAMWQAIGVKVSHRAADMKAHQQAVQQGDFDVARASWYAEARDPATFLELVHARSGAINVSGYRNGEFDRLFEAAERSADLALRAELLRQAEALAMRDQPIAPLYGYVSRRLVSSRIEGWIDNPRGVHLDRYLRLAR